MRIITGSTGIVHVTSNDDGCFNQAIFGEDSLIFKVGNELRATASDNNKIIIADGDILLQGRHARINPNATEEIEIDTGTAEYNRNDLIVARYTLDEITGVESIDLVVINGDETSGNPTDPEYTQGDIRTGATIADFPLYRVKVRGLNIQGIDLLANIVEPMDTRVTTAENNINATNAEVNSHSNQINDIKMLGWSVPAECPIQNYVDSNRVFHQRVGRVEISNCSIGLFNVTQGKLFRVTISDVKLSPSNTYIPQAYVNGYTAIDSNHRTDKSISQVVNLSSIDIIDNLYTDVISFKTAMQGFYLYYELATEITTPIDGNEKVEQINDQLKATNNNIENMKSITVARGLTYVSNDTIDCVVLLFGKRGNEAILTIVLKNGGNVSVIDYGGKGYITANNDANNKLNITLGAYTDCRLIVKESNIVFTQKV